MGPGAIYEIAESVPAVLSRPRLIYEGIKRDADDDQAGECPGWLCYVGLPPCRYDLRTGSQRTYQGRVMLVFVNDEKVVYTHRWEEEDSENKGFPADLENRFLKRVM